MFLARRFLQLMRKLDILLPKLFRRYAKAAANNNPRITILKASDEFNISDTVTNFHIAHQDQSNSTADFKLVVKSGTTQTVPTTFDMNVAVLTHNGVNIIAAAYANMLIHEMILRALMTVPSHLMESGLHTQTFFKEFHMAPGVMSVDGYEVQTVGTPTFSIRLRLSGRASNRSLILSCADASMFLKVCRLGLLRRSKLLSSNVPTAGRLLSL